MVPVLDDINNADEFKEVLQVSPQRATLRKTDTDQVDTISKAADPGKFKDEKKWPDWEPAFVNYLSTIPGVEGVPLSYVVRANDVPGHQTDFGDDFISRSVACGPLQGAAFRADARKVHQLLMNFLVAESADTFLDRMQKMFNIFKEEGEPIPDNAQIRELFKRVQHAQIQGASRKIRS